jgi:hypothetical protein
VDPVQRDDSEFLEHEAEPGADIIALPQLERLPPDPDGAELGGSSFTADNRSARLEALELVRAAVELADRIERDAQETAKDRLSRTEEEVRLRRLALDERETQLDHFKRELEGARQQLVQTEQELSEQRQRLSAAEAEAAAALASANERVEALNTEARTEADGILAAARSEAEAATAGIRSEAEAALEAARSEADGILAILCWAAAAWYQSWDQSGVGLTMPERVTEQSKAFMARDEPSTASNGRLGDSFLRARRRRIFTLPAVRCTTLPSAHG